MSNRPETSAAISIDKVEKSRHIVLTSHPPAGATKPLPVHWGAPTAAERGPLVATLSDPAKRNVIGAHAGAYALYRALAIASGKLSPIHVPDLTNIQVVERVAIPDERIPADARVEMDAKKAAGYFTADAVPDADELKLAKGRKLDE